MTIDAEALQAALLSEAYECPLCDDGEVQAGWRRVSDGRPPDSHEDDVHFVAVAPCTNCRIQLAPDDVPTHMLAGRADERAALLAQFFGDDVCRCDEPPFFRDLRGGNP